MSYLLDTDLISLTHKKHLPPALAAWLAAHEASCFISTVSIAEMRHGADLAPEGHREQLAADVSETETKFAEALEPVGLPALIQWKKVFAHLKSLRRTISCEDALLAAQCLAAGHTMATNNTKDFGLLKELGLKVVNPLAK
jgi:predicted nucleic acid-binding protein